MKTSCHLVLKCSTLNATAWTVEIGDTMKIHLKVTGVKLPLWLKIFLAFMVYMWYKGHTCYKHVVCVFSIHICCRRQTLNFCFINLFPGISSWDSRIWKTKRRSWSRIEKGFSSSVFFSLSLSHVEIKFTIMWRHFVIMFDLYHTCNSIFPYPFQYLKSNYVTDDAA
jgi:hypothetical protein